VAIGDIAFNAAQELASELSADHSTAFALNLDVTSKADFSAARDAILSKWQRIDALVNNAGASKVVPVMEITAEQFDQVINVNLRSVLFGCQVFGQHFADAGTGRIVNIASLAGQNGGLCNGRALRGIEGWRDYPHQGFRHVTSPLAASRSTPFHPARWTCPSFMKAYPPTS